MDDFVVTITCDASLKTETNSAGTISLSYPFEVNDSFLKGPDTNLKRKARKERARMLTKQREEQLKKAR